MLSGEERVAPLFAHGAAGADLAVIEGVMGLYDGALGTEGYSSTAHVSKLLQAPVVLVVDASAAGRSVGAVVSGFVSFDTGVRIVGVILNKVGSDRHEAEVRAGVAPTGVPVLGVLRRDTRLTVPSRHLGLIPADEQREQAESAVEAAAELVRQGVDLDAFVAAAQAAPPLEVEAWNPAAEVTPAEEGRPVIAMAGGPVFSFRYTETAELLTAAGAEVITFDPLHESLPEATSGLYLGGGFPELHAEALSDNDELRTRVAAEIAAGLPVIAECAGLLYLCRELDGHQLTGVLPATAQMTSRLTLGYRTAVAATTTAFFDEGRRVRGHEFHRTAVEFDEDVTAAWYLPGGQQEGFGRTQIHASYLHLHWTATPDVPARFVAAARVHAGLEK
jgi:cobyrinic acid a,c-diamide synthase